jgi:hypothetical protein
MLAAVAVELGVLQLLEPQLTAVVELTLVQVAQQIQVAVVLVEVVHLTLLVMAVQVL